MRLGLLLLAAVASAAPGFTIVKDGQVTAAIALATDATEAERQAADELAAYLAKATGGTFTVAGEAAVHGPAILVGPTALAKANKLVPDGPEAWRIKTVGQHLVITGGRPRGTLYGVYRFLEEVVGVHWWTPWEETVPRADGQLATLGDLDVHGEPVFRYRDVYDGLPEPKFWAAHNRLNGHFTGLPAAYGGTMAYGPPYHVHTFNLYFPPDEYFAAHPEYYSLVGGQRLKEQTQLCLTNPDVLRLMIEKVRHNIETSAAQAKAKGVPPPAVFSISQNDWYHPCECPSCKALAEREGSEAGPLINFVNQIADAVKTDYPWVFIDTLAYQYTLEPPKTLRPRDNVIIRLCDLNHPDQSRPLTDPNNQTFHDAVLSWSKLAKNLRIWDYAVVYGPGEGLPFPSLPTMPVDYRFLREHNVEGMFIEHEYPVTSDLRDLKVWVQAKLLEDPYQDYDQLVRTFTDGFYGPAGRFVRDYLAALDRAAKRKVSFISAFDGPTVFRYLDLPFLTEAQRIFGQGEAAVKDDPVRLRRLNLARLAVDRATLIQWRQLGTEHRAAGGTAATMPIDRDAVARRCRETLRATIAERLPKDQQARELPKAMAWVDTMALLPAFVELPEALRGRPAGEVIDLLPDGFRRWADEAKLIPDKDSQVGVTARLRIADTAEKRRDEYPLTDARPMPWGVYDTVNKKTIASTAIQAGAVPGPGYHLYKLENVALTPGCYVYFFWSWVIQADIAPNRPGERYDLYASIKFDGPGFPHGDPKADNAISIDRIVAVKH